MAVAFKLTALRIFGSVAQLGECYIRIVEVVGSNPIRSTKRNRQFSTGSCRFLLFYSSIIFSLLSFL